MKNVKCKIGKGNFILKLSLGLGIILVGAVLAGCQQAGTAVGDSQSQAQNNQGGGSWLPFSGGKVEPTVPHLKIKSITPTNEATGVTANTKVAIKFSEPVDPTTISQENIVLRYINPDLAEDQENIVFSTALDTNGEELQLVPGQNYLPGETVELVLTCGLKSRHDITLEKSDEAFLNNICYTSKFEVAP